MQIDDRIIHTFLQNRCTAEEARLVHEYLSDNPEVLKRYCEQDWKGTAQAEALNEEHAELMYRSILDRIRKTKAPVKRILPWASVAAAALIVMICTGTYLLNEKPVASVAMADVSKMKENRGIEKNVKQEKNNTGKQKKLRLLDGSVVMLSPGASISFDAHTDANKRELNLEGEAFFDVAEDSRRPFTVHAGNLSTTALGTSFKVTSTASGIRVKLITGKVVIRAQNASLPGWKKDIYLLPGQQMNYDAGSSLVKVSGPEKKEERIASATVHAPGPEMVFDNTPLEEVFSRLAHHHKVPISYSAGDLEGLSFSGTIFNKDELPVILNAIAQMNDLSLTATDNGFFIRKAVKE